VDLPRFFNCIFCITKGGGIVGYVFQNLNPAKRRVGDCVIRAIAKVMNMSWDDVAIDLSMMMVITKTKF